MDAEEVERKRKQAEEERKQAEKDRLLRIAIIKEAADDLLDRKLSVASCKQI